MTHHGHASMILVTKLDAHESLVNWLSWNVKVKETYNNVCGKISPNTIIGILMQHPVRLWNLVPVPNGTVYLVAGFAQRHNCQDSQKNLVIMSAVVYTTPQRPERMIQLKLLDFWFKYDMFDFSEHVIIGIFMLLTLQLEVQPPL